MARCVFTVAVLTIATGLGQGQPRPEFEVASVKPVDITKLGNAISMNIGTVRREKVTFGNATLNDCIRFAFRMGSDAQIVGPDWIKSKRFLYDVVARGAPGASREQLQAMMQTLLAERFKLVTHRERKEMSYYALVPAKNGPKMQPVQEIPDDFQGTTYGGASTAFSRCAISLTYFPVSRQSARSSIRPGSAECTASSCNGLCDSSRTRSPTPPALPCSRLSTSSLVSNWKRGKGPWKFLWWKARRRPQRRIEYANGLSSNATHPACINPPVFVLRRSPVQPGRAGIRRLGWLRTELGGTSPGNGIQNRRRLLSGRLTATRRGRLPGS
jgi:uncharacterized protein (TIGR03435 family)